MTIAPELETIQEIQEDVILLPTDLLSDEPPLETELHLRQIILLLKCLEWLWKDRSDFYAAANLSIYCSPQKIKNRDFRGPDFFVVLNTERKVRKSWTVWEEDGKYPHVIVEILSDSTASVDREGKKQLYQDIFRTHDYFWFDPYSLEFAGFHLVDGQYQPLEPNYQGYLWSQQLGLYIGIYQGLLRFFTSDGELVLTPEEVAESAIQQQQLECEQKEIAQQKAAKLAAKLRELNIDPDTI